MAHHVLIGQVVAMLHALCAVLFALCRFLPFHFGIGLRGRLLARLAAYAGRGIAVYPNVTIIDCANLQLGENICLQNNCYIDARGGVAVGHHSGLGPGSVVLSTGPGNEVAPVRIGADVWVGAHAVITHGVTLGDGCVVSAQALVTTNVAPYTIVAGSPARAIRRRT